MEKSRKISIRLEGRVRTITFSAAEREALEVKADRGFGSVAAAIKWAVRQTLADLGPEGYGVDKAAASAGVPVGQWIRLITLATFDLSPLAAHLTAAAMGPRRRVP